MYYLFILSPTDKNSRATLSLFYRATSNNDNHEIKTILSEGAKFSTMDFHHIGSDGSEPMGWQQ